jgi:hypothetical protein
MDLKVWAGHGPTKQLHSPLQPHWRMPQPPLTPLDLYILVCFKGLMGGAEAWSGRMSVLTQLVCTPATPMIV